MTRICAKCGQEVRRWHEPYVLVRRFDLRGWKARILEFFGYGPEKDRKRYHVSCMEVVSPS